MLVIWILYLDYFLILGQVSLKISVEHYQQAIKSHNLWLVKYTKSPNYDNAYNSLDVGTDFKWSAEGSGYEVTLRTKDELSVTFNKVNSLITKTSERNYRDQGGKIQFNTNFLAMFRKIQTAITIDGSTATHVSIQYTHSVPIGQKWNRARLRQEDVNYLCDRFYSGSYCPIKGSTFMVESCPKGNPTIIDPLGNNKHVMM